MLEVGVVEGSSHLLVSGGDYLMEFKFESADEVMSSEVVNLFVIVNVIDLYLELLLLLEVVLTGDGLHPARVQVIVNSFSLAKFSPDTASLLV